MTTVNALVEKINEKHVSSSGYINGLQGINASVMALDTKLVNRYASSIGAIKALVDAAVRISQRMPAPPAKLISDILSFLVVRRADVGEMFASGHDFLNVAFFWKVSPRSDTIARNLRRISYESAAFHTRPPTLEAVNEHVSRISEASARSYRIVPTVSMADVYDSQLQVQETIHEVFKIPQVIAGKVREVTTKHVFEPVSRVHEASKVVGMTPILPGAAIDEGEIVAMAVAPRVEPFIETSAADVLSEANRVSMTRRETADFYRASVSIMIAPQLLEFERVHQHIAKKVSDAYKTVLITPMSPSVKMVAERVIGTPDVLGASQVYPVVRVSKAVGDHVRSVSEVIGAGMIADSLSVPAVSPVVDAVTEQAMGTPGVFEAPQVYPVMEAVKPFFSTFPGVGGLFSDEMIKRYVSGQEMVDFYRMSTSIMFTPPLLAVSKVVSDHVSRVTEVMGESMVADSLGVPAVSPMVEAVAEQALEAPGVFEVSQLFPAVKAMEAVKPLFSAVLRDGMLLPVEIMNSYQKLVGDVREELPLALTSVVGLPSIAETMVAASDYAGAELEMSQALHAFDAISREAMVPTVKAGRAIEERVIKSFGVSVTDALLRVPVERYDLERVPLGTMVFPTLRLQEVIPLLHSIPTPAKTMPAQSTVNLNITVESLNDESDLRELERKVTRILKEQARRYRIL